jgi:Glycosyltransferase family 9 (heptosyltransferase)
VDRSVDFEALGLAALFEIEPDTAAERGWPARCAEELREAGHLVAWVGSRDPAFVRMLTALVPGAVVAPSVGSDRQVVWRHLLDTVGASDADAALRAPVVVPGALADEAHLALRAKGWDGQARLLVVHSGAGGRGKLWPTDGFAAVLARLAEMRPGLAVVVHRGPADSEAVAALSARLSRRELRLDDPPLPLLAGALSLAIAYLGNDSGISHLASALGVPAVLLFGRERITWRPWAEHVLPQLVSMPTLDEADVARVLDALRPLLVEGARGRS